eukprot:jgi/Mesvir1/3502/Mv11985-RA.2
MAGQKLSVVRGDAEDAAGRGLLGEASPRLGLRNARTPTNSHTSGKSTGSGGNRVVRVAGTPDTISAQKSVNDGAQVTSPTDMRQTSAAAPAERLQGGGTRPCDKASISTIDPLPFTFKIIVMSYDRPDSLRRALTALRAADYEGDQVSLEIFLDHVRVEPPLGGRGNASSSGTVSTTTSTGGSSSITSTSSIGSSSSSGSSSSKFQLPASPSSGALFSSSHVLPSSSGISYLRSVPSSSSASSASPAGAAAAFNRRLLRPSEDSPATRSLESRQLASSFEWPHGPKRVAWYSSNVGTQGQWLQAWYPTGDDEYAYFVEDDVEVSPYFYAYLKRMILRYRYNGPRDPSVYGISLQRQTLVPALNLPKRESNHGLPGIPKQVLLSSDSAAGAHSDTAQSRGAGASSDRTARGGVKGLLSSLFGTGTGTGKGKGKPDLMEEAIYSQRREPFLYTLVGTWGQLMFPEHWREFREWYDARRESGLPPRLPGSITDNWYLRRGEAIWTPWFLRFVYSRRYFNVYTSLSGGRALSVSHRDTGVNFASSRGPDAPLVRKPESPRSGSQPSNPLTPSKKGRDQAPSREGSSGSINQGTREDVKGEGALPVKGQADNGHREYFQKGKPVEDVTGALDSRSNETKGSAQGTNAAKGTDVGRGIEMEKIQGGEGGEGQGRGGRAREGGTEDYEAGGGLQGVDWAMPPLASLPRYDLCLQQVPAAPGFARDRGALGTVLGDTQVAPGTVVLLLANRGQHDFLQNWACSARSVGVSRYIVFAPGDPDYAAELHRMGYTVVTEEVLFPPASHDRPANSGTADSKQQETPAMKQRTQAPVTDVQMTETPVSAETNLEQARGTDGGQSDARGPHQYEESTQGAAQHRAPVDLDQLLTQYLGTGTAQRHHDADTSGYVGSLSDSPLPAAGAQQLTPSPDQGVMEGELAKQGGLIPFREEGEPADSTESLVSSASAGKGKGTLVEEDVRKGHFLLGLSPPADLVSDVPDSPSSHPEGDVPVAMTVGMARVKDGPHVPIPTVQDVEEGSHVTLGGHGSAIPAVTAPWGLSESVAAQDFPMEPTKLTRNPASAAATTLATHAVSYGTLDYQSLMLMRTAVVMEMLALGYDVLLADIDAVWLKDPIPHVLARAVHEGLDVLGQRDGKKNMCGGFLFLRGSRPGARALWATVLVRHASMLREARAAGKLKNRGDSEQAILSKILQTGEVIIEPAYPLTGLGVAAVMWAGLPSTALTTVDMPAGLPRPNGATGLPGAFDAWGLGGVVGDDACDAHKGHNAGTRTQPASSEEAMVKEQPVACQGATRQSAGLGGEDGSGSPPVPGQAPSARKPGPRSIPPGSPSSHHSSEKLGASPGILFPNFSFLDSEAFPDGQHYFEGPPLDHNAVMVVHNNFIVGKENKLRRFRDGTAGVHLWRSSCREQMKPSVIKEALREGRLWGHLQKLWRLCVSGGDGAGSQVARSGDGHRLWLIDDFDQECVALLC